MKKIVLFIVILVLVLIIGLPCFADVTGEIISIDKDVKGSIRVWTQYKVDGVEVESLYPKIGGKYVFCSRYNAINFAGMSDAQIKDRIDFDVERHTESLLKNTYISIVNDDIIANHLGTIVGSTTTTKDLKINVDTDGDGVNDAKVTIKTDGSQSSVSIP